MKLSVARNLAILAAGWGIFCHSAMPRLAAEEMAPVKVLEDFDQPFLFSYLSWQDKAVTRDGVAILRGFDNRGGAGKPRSISPTPAGPVPSGNVNFAKRNHQAIPCPMLEEFSVDAWADNILVWGYLAERP